MCVSSSPFSPLVYTQETWLWSLNSISIVGCNSIKSITMAIHICLMNKCHFTSSSPSSIDQTVETVIVVIDRNLIDAQISIDINWINFDLAQFKWVSFRFLCVCVCVCVCVWIQTKFYCQSIEWEGNWSFDSISIFILGQI